MRQAMWHCASGVKAFKMDEKTKTIWVIPDIHGRLDLLLLILAKLESEQVDQLIFLGDMVDRGPDGCQVVQCVKDMVQKNEAIALFGNHEDMMCEAVDRGIGPYYGAEKLWKLRNNGGQATENSYGGNLELMKEHVAWFKTLPLFHREDGFFFSHAPVPHSITEMSYENPFSKRVLTWSYPGDLSNETHFAKKFPNGAIGVCGHIHALMDDVTEPRFYHHYIYADAGCGCAPWAPLVAIEVKSRRVLYAWGSEEYERKGNKRRELRSSFEGVQDDRI